MALAAVAFAGAACGILFPTETCACPPQVPSLVVSGMVISSAGESTAYASLRVALVGGTCLAPSGEELAPESGHGQADAEGRYSHAIHLPMVSPPMPACVQVAAVSVADTLGRSVGDVVFTTASYRDPPRLYIDVIVP